MSLPVVIGFVLVFLVIFVLPRLGQVSSTVARDMVKAGAVLLDVRTAAEFSAGHIDGAKNVPVQELRARVEKVVSKDRPVVVYCASGARSAMARSTLKSMGYANVVNLGSMRRW